MPNWYHINEQKIYFPDSILNTANTILCPVLKLPSRIISVHVEIILFLPTNYILMHEWRLYNNIKSTKTG